MLSGSCLCGSVTYEISSQPRIMNLCHCSMCRKSSGSTYGTFIHVKPNTFRWLSGENDISKYETTGGELRAFCKVCGSGLPAVAPEEEYICIPAGTLDGDPGIRPAVQIFTGSKAPWHDISDNPVSFIEFEPDDFFD